MDAPAIAVADLRRWIDSSTPPLVIDVRRRARYLAASDRLNGALRRDPDAVEDWQSQLPAGADAVVYCVHGHEVSQAVARRLGVRFLAGGIEAWRAEGGPLEDKPLGASSRWVTRERPKIDRIACPWLIRRFIDPDAEFLYVPVNTVKQVAVARGAVPYDVPDVRFSHVGDACSFDAFLAHFRLRDPALQKLAAIVRGADTGHPGLTPQSAGLLAVSQGLSRNFPDDHAMLAHGMVMYDALYSWCRHAGQEQAA